MSAVRPAWARLAGHSYRVGGAWLRRGLRGGGFPYPRAGLYRLLVPVEPWRYYELGRVAAEPWVGRCLDVSSPKLLASALQRIEQAFATQIRKLKPDAQLPF